MDELSLPDLITIFKRRKKYFFVTSFVILAIALILALRWSNYRSTATVQIEQSYIASSVTNVSGMNLSDTMMAIADQRISQIQQRVTGLESLSEIIAKLNLYPGTRDNTPIAFLAERMREKIKLTFVSSTIANPAAAMKQTAEQLSAIAFNLSFDYHDPIVTQQVVGELITRFLDEDLKQRRLQAQETSAFLATQITQLENAMAEQEKAIAEFKSKNGESSLTALMFNQQASQNLAMSIHSIESQLTTNEGITGNIRAQLAVVEPYTRVIADGQVLTTPIVQLKALQAQYAALSAQYGPDHPDVVKARNQIKSLKAEVRLNGGDEDIQLEAQIDDLKTNLVAAQNTHGDDHPDVIALKRRLDKLEKRYLTTDRKAKSDFIKKDADNPAYLQLVSQLKSTEEQRKSLVEQKDALLQQQKEYEQKIAANPEIAKEMAKLTRDYENAQLRYREMKEKKMGADMTEQLEQGRKGQRLVVINPPAVPEKTQPARTLLMLGGLALSLFSGLTTVAVVEFISQSVHGANHLARIVGAMPLVTVPHMYTRNEKRSMFRPRNMLIGILRIIAEIFSPLINVLSSQWNKRMDKNTSSHSNRR